MIILRRIRAIPAIRPAVADRYRQLGKSILVYSTAVWPLLPAVVTAGDLTGRVSDRSGIHSLAGAEVEVPAAGRRAFSGSDGEYRITGLPAGEYRVVVRYIGAGDYERNVIMPAEGEIRLDAGLEAAGNQMDEIVVIGQRAAQASALARQRAADTISSFLTRDGIGQFPDQNVTEAVRRLPGVSVQNDQGEGRFIVLRGLDPNLNSASLNGVRITAPESDIRAVALDVVAAELVESIEVQKSLIPELDGDAIGGAIDIRTSSALDRRGNFLSITGSGSLNDLSGEWSPKLGIDASTIINERLGLSLGASYFDRTFESKNVEPDDWTGSGGAVYAEEIQLRDYDITRTRIGVTAGVVYSSFEDQEFRSRVELDFGDASPLSGNGDEAVFNLRAGEEIGVERDIKDRNEKQTILSIVTGGESILDRWSLDYSLSYTRAEEDESDSFDPTVFERTFEEGELLIVQAGLRTETPRIRIAETSTALFTDPAEFEFDSTELVNGLAEDEEFGIKLDVARDFTVAGGQAQIKFGGRARLREKSFALTQDIFDDFIGDGDFLLSEVAANVDHTLNPINPVPSARLVRDRLGDLSDFGRNTAESEFESAAADYIVEEDIYAGYLQGKYQHGPWRIIGGVRLEYTDNDIRGNRVDFVEEDATFNGVVVVEDTTFVTPLRFTRDYAKWLPSLNLRFEATPELILRAAAYRSLVRPNIEDLSPRFVVEQDDGDEREGEFGNPDLDPFTAWNFDLGAEWYIGGNALLQAGVFFKSIDDFISRTVSEDIDFNGIFVNEGVIPLNGDTAHVSGLELNYQQAFTMLPAPFDGLLFAANYTHVDSEAEFGRRNIALPGTAENVYSAVLGYEKGPLSLRISGVYRDEYLDEVSSDGRSDRWIKEHFSLDFSANYRIQEGTRIFFEAVNLADEPFVAVARTADFGDRVVQFEEYGWTLNVGLRWTF